MGSLVRGGLVPCLVVLAVLGCQRGRYHAPVRSVLKPPASSGSHQDASGHVGSTSAATSAGEAAGTVRRPPHPGPPIQSVRPSEPVMIWPDGGAEFLDPNKIAETAGNAIAMNMFEPLLNYARGNAAPVPGVAERYEVSDDGLVYTFHLRHDAKWSNGRTVTARDFVYSWRRGLDPATGSRNAEQLWFLHNGRALNEGRLDDPSKLGVEAVDDFTLRVTLENPTPFFPSLVASIAYAPVPREAVEKWGNRWTRPEYIVVNGPYKLVEWKVRDRVVLEKNPLYWDAEHVRLQRAVILHNESETNAWNLYRSGKVYWVPSQIPTEKIPGLIARWPLDFHIDPIMCTYYYVFRLDHAPFDDVRVRRAFNMAVDKERLVRQILHAGQRAATHLVPEMFEHSDFEWVRGYRSPHGDGYDPDKARALLAEAGYPDGSGLSQVEVVYNTYEGHRLIAEAIQRNLKEDLGVDLAIHNMEWKSLLKRLHRGDFQIGRSSWCADYPDPMTFLSVFHSDSQNNYAGYHNPDYDALLERINRTRDRTRRNALIGKAEAMLNRDVPFLPLYFYVHVYLLNPYVRGFEPQYQDNHLLKYMWYADSLSGGR